MGVRVAENSVNQIEIMVRHEPAYGAHTSMDCRKKRKCFGLTFLIPCVFVVSMMLL